MAAAEGWSGTWADDWFEDQIREDKMVSIPEELLEQVERGNVLLFVGERILRDAEGPAVLDQLALRLAARSSITDAEELSFHGVEVVLRGQRLLEDFVERGSKPLARSLTVGRRVLEAIGNPDVWAGVISLQMFDDAAGFGHHVVAVDQHRELGERPYRP